MSHNFSFDNHSICSLMNSLSLGTLHVFAWNVCRLSLSILRCDLCVTNRFFLVIFKKLTESISISGKLEKNQMKKSVAYLQKLFHLMTHIQQTYSECKSVWSKVVSIEGRFDWQKSILSKTRVTSIEDCNYCLNLLLIKCLKIFPDTVNFGSVQNTFLNLFFRDDRQPSVSIFGISLNAKA